MDERYVDQVRLLLGVLPDVAGEGAFALKSGTAINLLYRDMPRLSVDIDLTYLPVVHDREASLRGSTSRSRRPRASVRFEWLHSHRSPEVSRAGRRLALRESGPASAGYERPGLEPGDRPCW